MPKPKVISARYRSESRIAGIDSSFFSSRRRHTRYWSDWSSDVCSSDLVDLGVVEQRVLVEIRRSEREPCVIDDAHLRMDIHRRPAAIGWADGPCKQTFGAIRLPEHTELTARA